MIKSYLLGIDIGTSACKVALFNKEGQVKAAANGDYPVYYPHEGWAEQNPEEWWSAVCGAIRQVLKESGISPEDILIRTWLIRFSRPGTTSTRSVIFPAYCS